MQNCAYLGCSGKYSEFSFNEYFIRFRTSSHLQKYSEIKYWDNGYLEVLAKYTHNSEPEEEYIDLVPILKNLYIEAENFLSSIKKVEVRYA